MGKDNLRKLKKEKKRREQLQKNKLHREAQSQVTTMDRIRGKKHLYIILAMAVGVSGLIFYSLRG